MNQYDVYSYGMASSSTLVILKQPFPAPEGYAEIDRIYTMTGGEACNSSIVLSRLGLRVQLDGVWIGDTAEGRGLLDILNRFQVDTGRMTIQPGFAGVQELVISDERTRTIFGNYIELFASTRKWNAPSREDIQAAAIACLDPFFREESELVGRLAHESGVPYVTIDCPYTSPLCQHAAALAVSGEFRRNAYPQADLLGLFREYQARADGLVIFTCGSEAVLYARRGQAIRKFQPYAVQAVDTAGAGDSFRSGIVYGLLQGWEDEAVVRYASALAALICMSFPGVLNCPTHAAVLEFMNGKTQL